MICSVGLKLCIFVTAFLNLLLGKKYEYNSDFLYSSLPDNAKWQIESDLFAPEKAIPSNQEINVIFECNDEIYRYCFEKKTGKIKYDIPVSKEYELVWSDESGNSRRNIIERETVVSVEREYSYYKIVSFEIFIPSSFEVYGDCLTNGMNTIQIDVSTDFVPSYAEYKIYDVNIDDSLKFDSLYAGCEVLKNEGGRRPAIESADSFYNSAQLLAEESVSGVLVRNDMLLINGHIILNDAWSENELAPDFSCLYEPVLNKRVKVVTDKKALNGEHILSGGIWYKCVFQINENGFEKLYVPVDNPKSIMIFDPVICDAHIKKKSENNIKPQDIFQKIEMVYPEVVFLSVDKNNKENVFEITISNYGEHIDSQGYGQGYYAGKNRIRFSLDIYHVKDSASGKTELIPKGKWINIDDNAFFEIPINTKESIYFAECETIAENCCLDFNESSKGMKYANTEPDAYIAYTIIPFYVTGKIQSVDMRLPNGEPIGDELLDIGQAVVLDVCLTSMDFEDGNLLCVKPSFYVIDENNSRKKVDLYYIKKKDRKDYLIKVGSSKELLFPTVFYPDLEEFNNKKVEFCLGDIRLFQEQTNNTLNEWEKHFKGIFYIPSKVYISDQSKDLINKASESIIYRDDKSLICNGVLCMELNVGLYKNGELHLEYENMICLEFDIGKNVSKSVHFYGKST